MQKILLLALILSAVSTQEFSNPDGIPFTLSFSIPLMQRQNDQYDNLLLKPEYTYYSLFGVGISDFNKNMYITSLSWKMPISNIVTLYGNFFNSKNSMGVRRNTQTIHLTAHIPLYKWFQ